MVADAEQRGGYREPAESRLPEPVRAAFRSMLAAVLVALCLMLLRSRWG